MVRSGEAGGGGMRRERPRSVRVVRGEGWDCGDVRRGRAEGGMLRRTSAGGS